MAEHLSLFESPKKSPTQTPRGSYVPLAARLRPQTWSEYAGLDQLDSDLIGYLKKGEGVPPSLIFWGPPGSGKTTLAKLIGETFQLPFVELSAVLGSVKDVRAICSDAKRHAKPTLLFVDEIHRFSKSQQDAFLPAIESGLIILLGATTENPSFALTRALLSRGRVVVLPELNAEALKDILHRFQYEYSLKIDERAGELLTRFAGGDARALLNFLEDLLQTLGWHNRNPEETPEPITQELLKDRFKKFGTLRYDRDGEEHYNITSAFIKSLRGSDPDAALYWGFRMLEGGEPPNFLIRRMIIFASEDIGNADSNALQVATSTAEAFDRVGLPEGRIPIAQCITYLATAPKSNASYAAMKKALRVVRDYPDAPVPLHLRNAPTDLMKELGYGKDYLYPHTSEEKELEGVRYLPEEVGEVRFYEP